MARQGSVSFGASRRPLYDAVVGALFVLICAASVYLPILLLPGAIVLCALLRGRLGVAIGTLQQSFL